MPEPCSLPEPGGNRGEWEAGADLFPISSLELPSVNSTGKWLNLLGQEIVRKVLASWHGICHWRAPWEEEDPKAESHS